jgi:transposase
LADTKEAGGERRRWAGELKREVVSAPDEPGASVSSVARRYDVSTDQLFEWRRQFAAAGAPSADPVRLLPVELAPLRSPTVEERGGSPPVLSAPPAPVITLPPGRRVWLAAGHTDMRPRRPKAAAAAQTDHPHCG